MPASKPPQEGGYVKLWRSIEANGHLQMPEIPFKLFVFLLLRVNRFPSHGCDVGEGWITYAMIKDACCKRKPWANSTISRALDYLEGDNNDGANGEPERYIERLGEGKGKAQRIRVINYRKYQEETCSVAQQVDTQKVQTCSPVQQVALHKQECIREEGGDARVNASLRPLPDNRRDDWLKAHEWWFLNMPAPKHIDAISKFIRDGGMTDRLVVAVIEKALSKRKPNPVAWAKTVLEGLMPYGITTVDEWEAFEREREASEADEKASGSAPKVAKATTPAPRPTVVDDVSLALDKAWGGGDSEQH